MFGKSIAMEQQGKREKQLDREEGKIILQEYKELIDQGSSNNEAVKKIAGNRGLGHEMIDGVERFTDKKTGNGQSFSESLLAEMRKNNAETQDKMQATMETAALGGFASGTERSAMASENDISFNATGGFVPGVGNKDSVPSMLMPGEFVMNKASTQKHAWLLKALNENKFATGGLVGGSLVGTAPSADTAGASIHPKIAINIRGDSINKIMKTATAQLFTQLNRVLVPQGSSGRQFDQTSTT
jgi:hypothetical protein